MLAIRTKNVPAVHRGGVDGIPRRIPQLGIVPWRAKGLLGARPGCRCTDISRKATSALWGGPITSLLAANRKIGTIRVGGVEGLRRETQIGIWESLSRCGPPLHRLHPAQGLGRGFGIVWSEVGLEDEVQSAAAITTGRVWSDSERSRPSCESSLSVCP